jgi:hypothetical protein
VVVQQSMAGGVSKTLARNDGDAAASKGGACARRGYGGMGVLVGLVRWVKVGSVCMLKIHALGTKFLFQIKKMSVELWDPFCNSERSTAALRLPPYGPFLANLPPNVAERGFGPRTLAFNPCGDGCLAFHGLFIYLYYVFTPSLFLV